MLKIYCSWQLAGTGVVAMDISYEVDEQGLIPMLNFTEFLLIF